MMQLYVNGEPYVYSHKCSESENYGITMTSEGTQRFLVDALYETFCRCGAHIRKVNDNSWKYGSSNNTSFFRRLLSTKLKQQPDLVYRMDGDPYDTWFYVMPSKDDISHIDMEFIEKSVNKQGILPVLIVGYLWCFDTNGERNICPQTVPDASSPVQMPRTVTRLSDPQ